MSVSYLEVLAGIAISLSILMAIAWMVQQRTGNSGWVDTIWTFSVGAVGAGSALWPSAGAAPNARQWLVAALVAVWSLRLGMHIAVRTAVISDDPRYAAFAPGMGRGFAAPDVHLPAEPGVWIDPAGVCDFRRGAVSRSRAAAAGLSGRTDPVGRYRRRSPGRRATEEFPQGSRPQGQGLRCRAVALVAPSELFLRVARLAGLSGDRDLAGPSSRLSLGLGGAAGAGLHVLDSGARHRHPPARAADAALAARALSRLPVAHQHQQQMLRSRRERYRDYQSRTSMFFPLPPQTGVVT